MCQIDEITGMVGTMKLDRKSLFKEVRDYVMITIPGIASIIYWGAGIPVQITYFGINAILMVLALRILGLKFCIKTIYGILVLTFALDVAQRMTAGTHLLDDQPFMAAVIGAAFCGCGVGLGLSSNGSTGGTDIVAAIINKYRDISLGRVILICDLIIISCSIISCSYFVLHDWERVIYGYVVLIITSFCIDQVVNSMRRSVQFFIISDKYEEIGHRINSEPHRGCTVIDAHGFYSGKEVKMLFVLAKKRESGVIFHLINEIDPTAFVSQSAVIGVYGEGFDRFKVRSKSHKSKES